MQGAKGENTRANGGHVFSYERVPVAMRIVDLCRLAWNSIGRNATRSALTGIGVAIAVAALFALLSYGAGLQQVARSEYNALQLYNTLRVTTHYIPSLTSPREAMSAPQEPVPLTDSLVQAIEAVSGVRAAYPEVTFPATVDANGQRLPVAGEAIPQTFQSIAAYQPISGRFFSSSNAAEVLLSPSVARRLGFTPAASVVGDTIQLSTASLNFDRLTSMLDDGQEDAKIIAIHLDDPAFNDYWHIKELPDHRLRELKRFFQDYKALEDKTVRVQDFFGPDRAKDVIRESIERYDAEIRPTLDERRIP